VPFSTHSSETKMQYANLSASPGKGEAGDALQSSTPVGRSAVVSSGLLLLLALMGGLR
jgi:hypothetical protein